MVKLFKAEPMTFTPFAEERDLEAFKTRDIYVIDDVSHCDIVISRKLKPLWKFRLKFGARKKFLVWTHEPRYNMNFKSRMCGSLWLPDVMIMNTYTGDTFLDNYIYLLWKSGDRKYEPIPHLNNDFSALTHRKIVAMMTFKDNYNQKRWSVKKDKEELDLIYLRTQIAALGYEKGIVDIYGKGWPEGISLGNSRDKNWCSNKKKVLENYHFNLCFENTNIEYYCTEKIWDSIQSYCLPIYYGKGNAIYKDFPRDSFLDYADFENPNELFSYISQMSVKEFRERLNACIEVMNTVLESDRPEKSWEKRLEHTTKRLKEIAHS